MSDTLLEDIKKTEWVHTVGSDNSVILWRGEEPVHVQAASANTDIPVEAVVELLNWERANYVRALELGMGLVARIEKLEKFVQMVADDNPEFMYEWDIQALAKEALDDVQS